MTDMQRGARGAWAWWPLRFLVLFVVFLFLYAGSQIAVGYLVRNLTQLPKNVIGLGAAIAGVLIMLAVYRLLVRRIEHRPVDELSPARALPLLIGGALMGFVLFAGVYAVLWAYGAVTFQGWNTAGALAPAFALSLLAGVGEELIFRGVVYRLLEKGFGTLVAILLSGALFGLIHAANRGATAESTIAIALEAGILLAAAYIVTRSLWLPIGLHFGWNFTEGGIFGAAVSGGQSKGLLHATLSGPASLTGGTFGPEASIPAVSICLVAAAAMLVIAAWRGEWRPLTFRLRTD